MSDAPPASGQDLEAAVDALAVEISCGGFVPPASPYGVTLEPEQYCGCAREVSLEELCGAFTEVYLAPDGDPGGAGTAGDPVDGLQAAQALCAGAPCRMRAAEGTYTPMNIPAELPGEPGTLEFAGCASLEGGLQRADWTAGGAETVIDAGDGTVAFQGHTRIERVTLSGAALNGYLVYLRPSDGETAIFSLLDGVSLLEKLQISHNAGPTYVCGGTWDAPGAMVDVNYGSNAVVEGVELTTSEHAIGINVSSNVVVRDAILHSQSPIALGGEAHDIAVLGSTLDSSGTYGVSISGEEARSIHIEGNAIYSIDPYTSPLPEPDPVRDITVINNTETIVEPAE